MNYEFFPGANTPHGFYSRFDDTLQDPRLRCRVYIKGGPGCGKSTLMRRLARLARDRGADTALGLCSSDPDSLDLVYIPQAGFAICDATAPHVCEPPLGGCDGVYFDLSRFYSPEVYEHTFVLNRLQSEARACYAPATHLLASARSLYRSRELLIDRPRALERVRSAAGRMAARLMDRGSGGFVHRCFLTGLTPKGYISLLPPAEAGQTVYLLRDSYHLAGAYLEQLLTEAVKAGHPVIAGYSPLFAEAGPEQVVLPGQGAVFVRRSSHVTPAITATHIVDLDDMTDETADARAQTEHVQEVTGQVLQSAVSHLHRAKQLHDELEAMLHPYVDFTAVTRAGTALTQRLEALLDAAGKGTTLPPM